MRRISTLCMIFCYLIAFNMNRPNYDDFKNDVTVPIHAVAVTESYKYGLSLENNLRDKNKEEIHIFDIPQGLSKKDFEIKTVEVTPKYTEQELYELTAVIYQESGSNECSDEMQLLVGNVVLNRVESPYFADTIHDVLMSKHQYGLMWKQGIHLPNTTNEIELKAIERCRNNAIRLLNGERFCPKNILYQSEFLRLGDGNYKKFKTRQGTMYFNYKN